MKADAEAYAKRCDRCQRYSPVPRAPPAELTSIEEPIPFARWGFDLIGSLPTGPGGVKYAIVAVDYFTKWAEAKALNKIGTSEVIDFLEKQIIFRYGVPLSFVSDNALQFDNDEMLRFCDKYGISKNLSSVAHPKCNGQVEAVNKIIKTTLKKRLRQAKGRWSQELQEVLWAYRTTARTSTGETPFSLTYGVEAMLPIELSIPSYRFDNFDDEINQVNLEARKDFLEEKRIAARQKIAGYQQRVARFYNSKVRARLFKIGDLVLRKVMPNTAEPNAGALGATWEGPYRIRAVIRPGTYLLEHIDGRAIRHSWNAEHLKTYYQ